MGQSRTRHRSRGGARQGGGVPPGWVALGVLVALGLAIWAGLSIVSLPGGEEPGVASEPPHAEIDERSRERLVEILREDEEAGR